MTFNRKLHGCDTCFTCFCMWVHRILITSTNKLLFNSEKQLLQLKKRKTNLPINSLPAESTNFRWLVYRDGPIIFFPIVLGFFGSIKFLMQMSVKRVGSGHKINTLSLKKCTINIRSPKYYCQWKYKNKPFKLLFTFLHVFMTCSMSTFANVSFQYSKYKNHLNIHHPCWRWRCVQWKSNG